MGRWPPGLDSYRGHFDAAGSTSVTWHSYGIPIPKGNSGSMDISVQDIVTNGNVRICIIVCVGGCVCACRCVCVRVGVCVYVFMAASV